MSAGRWSVWLTWPKHGPEHWTKAPPTPEAKLHLQGLTEAEARRYCVRLNLERFAAGLAAANYEPRPPEGKKK